MGISIGVSRSTEDQPAAVTRGAGNPNPHRFRIVSSKRIGAFHLARIRYPDCTSHEGMKLLVLNRDPHAMAVIDPHFTEDGYVVARFAPTDEGMSHAKAFLGAIA